MSQDGTARRRLRRSAEEKRSLIAAWEASGLSARSFERQQGLPLSVLWRWKREAGARPRKSVPKVRPAITFAPVLISKPQSQPAVSERVIAEVVLGRDMRLRVLEGADVEQLTRLVRALAGGVAC